MTMTRGKHVPRRLFFTNQGDAAGDQRQVSGDMEDEPAPQPAFRRVGWTLLVAVCVSVMAWAAIIAASISIFESLGGQT